MMRRKIATEFETNSKPKKNETLTFKELQDFCKIFEKCLREEEKRGKMAGK